jgi:hypothetical protein
VTKNELVKYLENNKFDSRQINQIFKIYECGYDILKYFSSRYQIHINAIEEGYIKPTDDIEKLRKLKDVLLINEFNNDQLTEVLKGYEKDVNYSIYCNVGYTDMQMEIIRYGLEAGLNVNLYNDSSYDWTQMLVLLKILKHNNDDPDRDIDIRQFQNKIISGDEMYTIFNDLLSCNQKRIIDAYRKLHKYDRSNRDSSVDFDR